MINTHDYIQCYRDSFWYWDSQEQFLVLKDGPTFSHWQETRTYLSNLSSIGLPPFELFLGILAATIATDSNDANLTMQAHLIGIPENGELHPQLKILDTIKALDPKYKSGDNRFLLVAALMDKSSVKLIRSASERIVGDLMDPNQHFYGIYGPKAQNHKRKLVNQLHELSNYFPDPESIVTAMLGFNKEQFEFNELLPQVENAVDERTFIEQLEADIQTEKMALLIPYVLSGLNFPIHARQSSERPEGGVSDLSNKGHFDQLLVSEFAYDEDYFLSRIVNNEALYFQRERAQNRNDDRICILTDASLYMWGLPKVLSLAISCSIGLKEEEVDLDCFVVGDGLEPCDMRTINGVLKAVRVAEAAISPAIGLKAFSELGNSYSNVLFITTELSWKRNEMAEIRSISDKLFDFLIFTNQAAEVHVQKAKGGKLVNFKLDVDAIWSLKKSDIPALKVESSRSFPILYPICNDRVKYYFNFNHAIYFIDRSRQLFIVQDKKTNSDTIAPTGAKYILTIEPGLDHLGDIGLNSKFELELLMFSTSARKIVIYNLNKRTSTSLDFKQWKPRYGKLFYHKNGRFYLLHGIHGTWFIDETLPTQNEPMPVQTDLVKEAIARAQNIKSQGDFRDSFISKVRSVSVSSANELVIQNKCIDLQNEDAVYFFRPPSGNRAIISTYSIVNKQQVFTFNSGESVVIYPAGIIEFRFLEKHRPIGFELVLNSVGRQNIETIKLIREITGQALTACKSTVEDGRGIIAYSVNEDELNQWAQRLQSYGNKVSVRPLQLGTSFFLVSVVGKNSAIASQHFFAGNQQYKDNDFRVNERVISAPEFAQFYLNPFIQCIQDGN